MSVLFSPKVWKETIDSTRVYSSVVGWRQAALLQKRTDHRLLEFRREATNDRLNNNAINGDNNLRTSLTIAM